MSSKATSLRHIVSLLTRHFAHPPSGSTRIIAITGSVAAGKSTFARALRRTLSRQLQQTVECVCTDGFLRSDPDLERDHLWHRKGFPESYHHGAISKFLAQIQERVPSLTVPQYSHRHRAVTTQRSYERPNWLILEGVFSFQPLRNTALPTFKIFLDTDLITAWSRYEERFLRLHGSDFKTQKAAQQRAIQLFSQVNAVNYQEHISQQRLYADLIL